MFRAFLRRCERQYPHYRDVQFEEMIEWHEPHFTQYRHEDILDDMLWHICCFDGITDLVGEVYKDDRWMFEYRMMRLEMITDDYIVIYIRTAHDVSKEHILRVVPVSKYIKGCSWLKAGY